MADYAAIITAIDAAVTEWVGEPVMLSESGRSVTYRSLDSLISARKYYVNLQLQVNNKKGFRITNLKAGGAR